MQQKWPMDVWATQVAGLLSGKALAAYAALTPEDAVVYDTVKGAILRRYEINEETYRQWFRTDRKKGEESYREYVDRLGDHFSRWVTSQSIGLDSEELVKIEQFISGVPEDLRIWLRERKPESLRRAVSLADDYALAHKSNLRVNPGRPTVPSPTNSSRQQESSDNNGQGQSQQSHPTNNLNRNGRSQTNARGDKRCFQCGKFGHLMYSCPETHGQATKPALSGMGHCTGCSKVTWNQGSQKYLR